MTHEFDRDYWDAHWRLTPHVTSGALDSNPPNPYLARAANSLVPGTALDAGCGAGAEAIWLATHGWQVTAADVSRAALARAAQRASTIEPLPTVTWVEADLTVWSPDTEFDLVTTNYAHPSIPQLAFYERVSAWVAPGGTLLIVGHGHGHVHGHSDDVDPVEDGHDGQHPPAEASVTVADIVTVLDDSEWEVIVAEEQRRTITGPEEAGAGAGHDVGVHGAALQDVVVQATRRARRSAVHIRNR